MQSLSKVYRHHFLYKFFQQPTQFPLLYFQHAVTNIANVQDIRNVIANIHGGNQIVRSIATFVQLASLNKFTLFETTNILRIKFFLLLIDFKSFRLVWEKIKSFKILKLTKILNY